MLRIIQNKSASSAKSYYSHSDYLSEGQELVGYWHGKGAALLGLSGIVQKADFDRLCDNLHPETGERLTLRTKNDRTIGYDMNFHVPKGVSIAYSLGKDSRILRAFRESVRETMEDIEADASTRVRKNNIQSERPTGNLVWSEHVHTTGRPIDGEPDCHLHSHCFTFNVTYDEAEQQWKAVQFRELKRDASYYEAMFHVRLANRMQALGYDIRREGRDWDIADISKELSQKFSRRTSQIEALAKEKGIVSAQAKDQLGAKSRSVKEKSFTNKELHERWSTRLADNEKRTIQTIEQRIGVERIVPISKGAEAEAMAFAVHHSFERESVIGKRKLLTHAMRHGLGQVSVEGIHSQLNEQNILVRELHGREFATTKEVLAEEQGMIQTAKEMREASVAINPHWTIKRDWLNEEQKQAVTHVLSTSDQVSIIAGGAGTGKTSLIQEVADGIADAGLKLFTFAPSAEASRGVLRSHGFNATTLAELLASKELQAEVAHQVILVDEAGLIGTRQMKQLIDLAKQADAKLLLAGDVRQHGAVERGAALRLLEQEAGLKPVRISTIQRQSGEYKDIVHLLSKGETDTAILKLDALGWIKEIPAEQDRYTALALEYANAVTAGESVLAIAPTHIEADLLTASIRAELIYRGIVSGEEHSFVQLKSLRMTEAERNIPEKIREGDVVVFHRKSRNIAKGERFDAKLSIPGSLKANASKFDVYKSLRMTLAKGDRIRITGIGKTKDGKHALYNGSAYTVSGFTRQGDIELSNGWVIAKDYCFFAPGYVSTSHSSQGKTVKRVLVAESAVSHGAASREQFYVSLSRGTHSCSVYTEDKALLMDAVARTETALSAIELSHGDTRAIRNHKFRVRQSQQTVELSKQRQWEVLYERR